jgi:hypothetical protein
MAARVWEYDAPAKPEGKVEGVVMANGGGPGRMASVNVWLAVRKRASVTVTLNVTVPTVVGIPAITPAEESARPAGNPPEVTCHVYGRAP